jgi:hypothetical protein
MIDVTFDFRSDTPRYGINPRADPDKSSPTLRRYHQFLWSKPLPSGAPFDLDVKSPGVYLHHLSGLGEFWLSSDKVIVTLTGYKRGTMKLITDEVPQEETEQFLRISHTIAGFMVWPANKAGGPYTINGARGFDRSIGDRFDLTLECIRRYYLGEPCPGLLGQTLTRYPEFFGLFGDFAGFVDFFFLHDLVDEDTSTVKFFTPFRDFSASALPGTLDEYVAFRQRSLEFIESRNQRIAAYATSLADVSQG